MIRDQIGSVAADLQKKMVFLSGPRQSGKTWLAKSIMERYAQPRYLNWDNGQDREVILGQGWSSSTDLLVIDEIHKMDKWKSHLKGIWDTRAPSLSLLVTGSARLETFRQSGDSLAGRFFHHRLFPVTPAEAARVGERRNLEHFIRRGGFPEPWLADSDDEAGRWRRQYLDGLIREDILDFENITQLRAMNLLVELLRGRVASPVSYQGLSEDLGISPNTVKRYIEVLEALYIVFRVSPHSRSIARALVQQPKLYFFDVGLVRGDEGKSLENLVALSLHRELCLREDRDGKPRQLRYLRTKEGHETDFLLTEDEQPRLMVEVKARDRVVSKGLRYFNERYGFPGVQVVGDLRAEVASGPLQLRRAMDWLERPEEWETILS
jgi:predicted AAA+ superfamily ATPase